MSTLATLKAEIADDLGGRTDLATQIADAISRAIVFYQNRRFWFNETRDETFSTVASQARYSATDDPAIPEFVTLDGLIITVAGNNRPLRRIDPVEYELLMDNSASTGEPYCYSYFNTTLGLYPIPGDVYTVRMMGQVRLAAPAADDETDNAWMVEGYQLIRARAKADVAANKIRDYPMAQAATIMEGEEYNRLKAETSQRVGTGKIRATSF